MRKKHWIPFGNGSKAGWYESRLILARRFLAGPLWPWLAPGLQKGAAPRNLLAVCLAAFFLLPPAGALAEMTLPTYQLTVSFDLARQSLQGTAEILVPKGEVLAVSLQGMEVTALAGAGLGPDSRRGREVRLEATAAARRLTIHYRKSFAGETADLIGPDAIALSNSWYPLPDRDCIYQLQAVVPADFEAISEADVIASNVAPGSKVVSFDFPHPARFIHFIAGPYVVESESFGADHDKKLYSYFFQEDAELAAQYRQKALAYLERYEALIGPYPFARFSIVENRLPTGYAMPTFTLLGQSVVRLPFIVETSLGHEVLHSWFGNAVRVELAEGNWCEGLTTYLADHAYEEDKGEGAAYRKGQLLKYQSYVHADLAFPLRDFVGGDSGRGAAQFAERAIGYGKAAMFFHMLRRQVGDERFYAGLRDFYQRMNGKTAGWRDLRQSFETDPAHSLEDFFGQWLDRHELPALQAKELAVQEKNGALALSFVLQQTAAQPFRLEVPILLRTMDGERRETIAIEAAEKRVEFALASQPLTMIIDPDYDLMRVVDSTEMPPTWDWFLGSRKKLAIINSASDYDLFAPLIELVEKEGAEIVAANEVTDEELAANALIFMGISGQVPRSLFARPAHDPQGLTVDIRKNPLNPELPAILVSAAERGQLEAGLRKLSHYGKYAFLHFIDGRAVKKTVATAPMGISYPLAQAPLGIKVASALLGFDEIVNGLLGKRVIYVGESHTRYEDHKLQLLVIRELHRHDPQLAIGMEMFPREAQEALDQFVAGKIDEQEFLRQSDYFKVWSYDYRLYREILNFARAAGIPVLGLNIAKEMVSKVYRAGGISGLEPEEKMSLPLDRDLDLPRYRERIKAVFDQHPGSGHNQFQGFLQAQAIWDEVMAETAARYLESNPERRLVVLAGNGHVLKDNAIPPRLKRRLAVEQAIVMSAEGHEIYPPEVDYVVFMPAHQLPQPALMGIVMTDEQGTVTVAEIAPQSPAAQAGVRKGDLLLALDGRPVASITEVKILMLDKQAGERVTLKVRRPRLILADQELDLELNL